MAVFTKWLWSKRNQNLVFFPGVFLDSNTDTSLPRPALTLFEAQGLFYILEERKLVYPKEIDRQTAYCLNEIKVAEWEDFISDLGKPAWMRSKVLAQVGKALLWVTVAFVGGFLGALAEKSAGALYDHQTNSGAPQEKPNAASQTGSALQKPDNIPDPRPVPTAQPTREAPADHSLGLITVVFAGAIKQVGNVQVKRGSRVWDAIEQAGGLAPGYSPSTVRLTRTNPNGTINIYSLDIRKKDGSTDNMAIQDADVIYVRENSP